MSVDTGTDSDYGLLDTRYAIYFAPDPSSQIKHFADAWLGRDPDRDERVSQPVVDGISPARLHEITAAPAPLRLSRHAQGPVHACARRRGRRPCSATSRRLPRRGQPSSVRLKVDELDGFLALVPAEPTAEIDLLAADCVREFDRYRGDIGPDDRKRREAAALSDIEREYLERWGYPYVFDRFRFHMTLTGRLEEPERGQVKAILECGLGRRISRIPCATGPARPVHPDPQRRTVPRRRLAFPSAHELRRLPSDHPGLGGLHRADRGHDDHDGDDHRHQSARDPRYRGRPWRLADHDPAIVTIFFGGFAVGQLVWGPLSDRSGASPAC